MKMLHTSDWHLGRMIYGRSLLPDQEHFIHEVFFPAVRSERPDFVVIAGDIFDRSIAPAQAIRLFDSVIAGMSELGIPLFVITGNHDGADRIAVGTGLLKKQGIHIACRIEDVLSPVILQKGDEKICVYSLPYFDPAGARDALGREEIRGFSDAYAAVLEPVRASLDPGCVNILISHCFVKGGQVSDSESPLYIGGSGEIDASLFAGFDYVALGHLHAPQKAGPNGRYSGSPLTYSCDEERQRKSMSVVEFTGHDFIVRELPVPPLHAMRTLSGTINELLAEGQQQKSDDFIFMRLLDEHPVYMPVEQLRPYYPNLLGLSTEWMRAVSDNGDGIDPARRTDDAYIFEQFMQQVCGTQADDADRAIFRKAMQTAEGVRE
jgi:exonuclease SbcD